MTADGDCCLCAQIAGDRSRDLIQAVLDRAQYQRPLVYESERFVAMPSVGPLSDGHILVCPKDHVRSYAALDADLDDGAAAAGLAVERRLRHRYRLPVHLFEHGNGAASATIACSVEHAHLHLVPARAEIMPALRHRLRLETFDGSAQALRALTESQEYLRYREPSGRWHLALASENGTVPSQLLRRLLAAALGNPGAWNWRDAPRADVLDSTWRALAPLA